MNSSWQQLIADSVSGQESALEELIARYDFVVRHAVRDMGTPAHLSHQDLTQEVWIRVLVKLHTFQERDSSTDDPFCSWLRVTARRVALSMLRKKNLNVDGEAGPADLQASSRTPSSRARQSELKSLILESLAELSNPLHADLLMMRYVDKLTLDEISEASDLSKDQVRYALKLSEEKLRHRLDGLLD